MRQRRARLIPNTGARGTQRRLPPTGIAAVPLNRSLIDTTRLAAVHRND
jgi:hypothetical protein